MIRFWRRKPKTPLQGGILYVDSKDRALKYRSASGQITTLGPADPIPKSATG